MTSDSYIIHWSGWQQWTCHSPESWTMGQHLPETTLVFVNRSMGIVECGELCKKNCSCSGYANVEIVNGGSGCVMWVGELLDVRKYPSGGQDLYVRLAASDVGMLLFLVLKFVSLSKSLCPGLDFFRFMFMGEIWIEGAQGICIWMLKFHKIAIFRNILVGLIHNLFKDTTTFGRGWFLFITVAKL